MKSGCRICVAAACLLAACSAAAPGGADPAGSPVKRWQVTPTPLVAQGEPAQQKIDLSVECEEAIQSCGLQVWSGERLLIEKPLGALPAGASSVSVLLEEPEHPAATRWVLVSWPSRR